MDYFMVLIELCTCLLPSAYITIMLHLSCIFTAEISVHTRKHCNSVLSLLCWCQYQMIVDWYMSYNSCQIKDTLTFFWWMYEVHLLQPGAIFSTLLSIVMSSWHTMKCVVQQCTLHPCFICLPYTIQYIQFYMANIKLKGFYILYMYMIGLFIYLFGTSCKEDMFYSLPV